MSSGYTEAADILWEAWMDGRTIPELPSGCRPADLRAGYAIQAELDSRAGARVGWKIAATGAGGRKALGVEQPLAGPLYERFAVADGGEVDFSAIRMRTIEAEFGFVMARDLPADEQPFERPAVLAALGAFVPAIEIPNTRYDNQRAVGGPQLVADAACAGFFIFGPRVENYDPERLPSHALTLTTGGGERAEGTGAKVLDDPIEAVRWLANALAANGRGLVAGDTVITGAAAALREPGIGVAVAEYGELGSLTVNLT